MRLDVRFERRARDDLKAIFDWIAEGDVARAYLSRIYRRCDKLGDFPDQGSDRSDITPGLRTINFERRITVVYIVVPDTVRILRVLSKGQRVDLSPTASR